MRLSTDRVLAHVRPLVTFGLVGIVNTAVAYTCYLLLHLFLPYLAAFLLAWIAGIVTSYFLNARFTFGVRPGRGLFAYPLAAAPNVVFSTVGVIVMVEGWGWSERVAPLVATVLALPLSYLLARLILVRSSRLAS